MKKVDLIKTIMVLLMRKKINIFSSTYCFLIFTSNEIIVSNLNKKREIELFDKWQNENKDSKYALTQTDYRKYLNEYAKKYYEESIEDILKADKKNFHIKYSDIIRVWFKASKKSKSFKGEELGILYIQTTLKIFKFTHHYRDWNRNIHKVLSELFDNKIEYTEGDKALSPIFKDGMKGFH